MRAVFVIAFAVALLLSTATSVNGSLPSRAVSASSSEAATSEDPGFASAITAAGTYPVTIRETGLPLGTNWSVSLNESNRSSTSSSIAFGESNGTYRLYTWDIDGYSTFGNLTTTVTVRGAPVNVSLNYVPPRDVGSYFVTYVETGLPFNVYWTVEICPVINGTEYCGQYQEGPGPTHDATGVYGVPNGTYDWTVTLPNITEFPIPLDYPFPSQGVVVVNGSSLIIELTFRFAYPFNFIIQGVPASIAWSLQILNETFTGVGGEGVGLNVEIPNGTYRWIASAPGYQTQNGTATVQGLEDSNILTITLEALPQTSAPFSWDWPIFALGGGVVVVVGLSLLVLRRRRDARPPAPPPESLSEE